ncbi:MAG: STAS domain-containing protein [Planctomycetota bacterium]|nr:STAS domain-containing protein [Planctomycetota bacterium]
MKMPTEVFGDVVIVHAPEELGEDIAARFRNFVTTLEQRRVVVDLDGTEAFDSEGLACLLDVQDDLRESNGALKIISSNNVNRKILEITRLNQHLEVFDSVIDAVKSFV